MCGRCVGNKRRQHPPVVSDSVYALADDLLWSIMSLLLQDAMETFLVNGTPYMTLPLVCVRWKDIFNKHAKQRFEFMLLRVLSENNSNRVWLLFATLLKYYRLQKLFGNFRVDLTGFNLSLEFGAEGEMECYYQYTQVTFANKALQHQELANEEKAPTMKKGESLLENIFGFVPHPTLLSHQLNVLQHAVTTLWENRLEVATTTFNNDLVERTGFDKPTTFFYNFLRLLWLVCGCQKTYLGYSCLYPQTTTFSPRSWSMKLDLRLIGCILNAVCGRYAMLQQILDERVTCPQAKKLVTSVIENNTFDCETTLTYLFDAASTTLISRKTPKFW